MLKKQSNKKFSTIVCLYFIESLIRKIINGNSKIKVWFNMNIDNMTIINLKNIYLLKTLFKQISI